MENEVGIINYEVKGIHRYLIYLLQILIIILAIYLYHITFPFNTLRFRETYNPNKKENLSFYLMIAVFLLIIVHELLHVIIMKFFRGKNVKFKLSRIYNCTWSSSNYFNRNAYLVITMTPVIFLSLVFICLHIASSIKWAFIVYLLFIANFCGSLDDIYVFIKLIKMSPSTKVKNNGKTVTATK